LTKPATSSHQIIEASQPATHKLRKPPVATAAGDCPPHHHHHHHQQQQQQLINRRELELQFQAIKQASTEFLPITFVLPQFSQELHSLMFEE
jgi:hypothetical protein